MEGYERKGENKEIMVFLLIKLEVVILLEIIRNLISKEKRILISETYYIRRGTFPEPKNSIQEVLKGIKRVFCLKRISDDYFSLKGNECCEIPENEDLCRICFEESNNVIFANCNHTGFCLKCVKLLKGNNDMVKKEFKCPYCSKIVDGILKFARFGEKYVIEETIDVGKLITNLGA